MTTTIQLCGDSITYAGPGNNLAPGFRCNLYSQLTAAAIDFAYVGNVNSADCGLGGSSGLNDGYPGYKVLDLQNALVPVVKGGAGGVFKNSSLDMIMIGTNDTLQGGAPITSNLNPYLNLTALLTTLVQANPTTSFVISKIPPISDAITGHPGANARATAYNAALAITVSNASRLGYKVQLIDPGLTLADISADGVHPNNAGWNKIANAYFAAVQAFLLLPGPPFRQNPVHA